MRLKTEHSGGKNGGGFWGTRAEAKTMSRKARRQRDVVRGENTPAVADLPPLTPCLHSPVEVDGDVFCVHCGALG